MHATGPRDARAVAAALRRPGSCAVSPRRRQVKRLGEPEFEVVAGDRPLVPTATLVGVDRTIADDVLIVVGCGGELAVQPGLDGPALADRAGQRARQLVVLPGE